MMAHFAMRGLIHEAALKADTDPDLSRFCTPCAFSGVSSLQVTLFPPWESRPAELHRRPLAEPDVSLSTHPAPIKQTGQSNGLSVCRTHRSPPVSSCLGHATA